MGAHPVLNRVEQLVLETLGRCQFATQAQLGYYTETKKHYLSQMLKDLGPPDLDHNGLDYVKSQDHVRPYIYYLTNRGAAALATGLPAGGRPASWSVMANACHRNEFEIAMREKYPRFRFLSRLQLLKQGLNPSHGDYAALIDDTSATWYVLVDDYQMPPNTLAHRWTREHRPSTRHTKPGPRRRWCDVANRFIVACTDPVHAERHRAAIVRGRLPALVHEIKGLWT